MDSMEGIERLAPVALRVAAAHEAHPLVEDVAVRLAAMEEVLVVLLLAQRLCHLGDTSVGKRIFERLGNRLVLRVLVEGAVVVALQRRHSTLVEHGRCLHRLVGPSLVSNKALEDEVGEHGHARVANHAVGLIAHEVPHGELALLLVDVDEGLAYVGKHLGMQDGHQGVGSAVGVPKREGRIVGELALVYLQVGATVLAVDVAEDGRGGHRMVERGIEYRARILVVGLDLHAGELFLPSLVGLANDGIEVPARYLLVEVLAGVVLAHGRETRLDEQWCAVWLIGEDDDRVLVALQFDGLVELRIEERVLVARPSRRFAVATDRTVIDLAILGLRHLVPSDALVKVEAHHAPSHVGSRGVALESRPLRGGQFHQHVGVFEFHAIVARGDILALVGKLHLGLLAAAHGQEGHVAQFADTRAREVLVAEADDDGVAGMVAGAPVPSPGGLGRTQLHITEGNIGTQEHVAVAARAYQRIDILRVSLPHGDQGAGSTKPEYC